MKRHDVLINRALLYLILSHVSENDTVAIVLLVASVIAMFEAAFYAGDGD